MCVGKRVKATDHDWVDGGSLQEEDVDGSRQLVLPIRTHRKVSHPIAIHCMARVVCEAKTENLLSMQNNEEPSTGSPRVWGG
jgi:hypothetical protein